MTSDYLIETGQRLVQKYGTRDPFLIAEGLGLIVSEWPDFKRLKGMYTIIKRNRYVFLNDELDENTKRIVLAHEIGHDQLHRTLAKQGGLKEFTLYDVKSRPEYEANIVASEILLDTDELLQHIYEDHYTATEIAGIMQTDLNLVAMKVLHLNSLGYPVNHQDYRSDFLR